MPYLQGARRLWLLILPSFTYASTLGSTTAPVSLALNSGWSTPMVWAGGTATMLMCMIAVHVVAQMSDARARVQTDAPA
jgi:protein-S-isoprenylcysteine O-methyltransferase Ste14